MKPDVSEALAAAAKSSATVARLFKMLDSTAVAAEVTTKIKREIVNLDTQYRRLIVILLTGSETDLERQQTLEEVAAQFAAPGYGPDWFVQFYNETGLRTLTPTCRLVVLKWLMQACATEGFSSPSLWQEIVENDGLLPTEFMTAKTE